MKSEMNLDFVDPEEITLEDKMSVFKKDPQKMKEAQQFVDEVINEARSRVEAQNKAKTEAVEAEQGLKRRIGTRARGFIVRIFEAICNCTQTGTAAAARVTTPRKQ